MGVVSHTHKSFYGMVSQIQWQVLHVEQTIFGFASFANAFERVSTIKSFNGNLMFLSGRFFLLRNQLVYFVDQTVCL